MPHVVTVLNWKGGVGKTRTVRDLALNFARMGIGATAVDLDPQATLTDLLLPHVDDREPHIGTLLDGQAGFGEVIQIAPNTGGRLAVLPSATGLSDTEAKLTLNPISIFALQGVLEDYPAQLGQIVLIDTPPSLGTLTTAALLASDYLLIPTQPEPASVAGISKVLSYLREIKRQVRRVPKLLGLIVTMIERNNLHAHVLADLYAAHEKGDGLPVLATIPKRKGEGADADLLRAYSAAATDLANLLDVEARSDRCPGGGLR